MPSPALKAVRFALFAFAGVSVAAAVYKIAEPAPGISAAAETARPAVKPAPEAKAAEGKTAVVYYFYTNTRCSSCKTIEAYTKAAVEADLASGYKGWKIVFKG